MSSLIQIIYISRSTFPPPERERGIDPNVARILSKSRINNRRNGLVGVLYFGDGCFFQCLEGEVSVVDALYARLQSDPRHKDITLFSRKPITALSYADWEMKYVPLENEMRQLLAANGHKTFDPYKFDEPMIQKVMALLNTKLDPAAVGMTNRLIEKSVKKSESEVTITRGAIVAIAAISAAVGFGIAKLI